MSDDTFTDSGTTFRRFKAKSSKYPRRCGFCKTLISAGETAWKPQANAGSWKPDATVCESCGQKRKDGSK
jgi:hypothetical protein